MVKKLKPLTADLPDLDKNKAVSTTGKPVDPNAPAAPAETPPPLELDEGEFGYWSAPNTVGTMASNVSHANNALDAIRRAESMGDSWNGTPEDLDKLWDMYNSNMERIDAIREYSSGLSFDVRPDTPPEIIRRLYKIQLDLDCVAAGERVRWGEGGYKGESQASYLPRIELELANLMREWGADKSPDIPDPIEVDEDGNIVDAGTKTKQSTQSSTGSDPNAKKQSTISGTDVQGGQKKVDTGDATDEGETEKTAEEIAEETFDQEAVDGGVDETGSPGGWDPDTYAQLGENAKAFADENPNPNQYPGGVLEWNKAMDAALAQDAGSPTEETTEETTEAEEPDTWDDFMEEVFKAGEGLEFDFSDIEALTDNPQFQAVIDELLSGTGEISEEEESSIRRRVGESTQRALSNASARGLGRSSEAVKAMVYGEWLADFEVATRDNEISATHNENLKEAAKLLLERSQQKSSNTFAWGGLQVQYDIANQNYQAAMRDLDITAIRDANNASIQDRVTTIQEEAQDFTEEQWADTQKQWEAEFGLAFDSEKFKQMITEGQFKLDALDSDRTYHLKQVAIVNSHLEKMTELEITDKFNMSKLELQKWMAGEGFDIDEASLKLQEWGMQMGFELDLATIQAGLQAQRDANEAGWQQQTGQLFTNLARLAFLL